MAEDARRRISRKAAPRGDHRRRRPRRLAIGRRAYAVAGIASRFMKEEEIHEKAPKKIAPGGASTSSRPRAASKSYVTTGRRPAPQRRNQGLWAGHPHGGRPDPSAEVRQERQRVQHLLSRSKLNDFLLGEAEKAGSLSKIRPPFGECPIPADSESPTQLEFTMGGGGTCLTACFGPVIGSDGAGSALRRAVPAFEASSDILAAGYKEVLLPAHCSQT